MYKEYQKNYEGQPFAGPVNGVIDFYPMANGQLDVVTVKMDQPSPTQTTWQLKSGSDVYATIVIDAGDTEVAVGAINLPVARMSPLILNLTDVDAGGIVIPPIALQLGIYEANTISYDDLIDVPPDNVFNVKDYGAASDAVTDDTDALSDALDAAKVTGGIIFFPAGTTVINAGTIDKDFAQNSLIFRCTPESRVKITGATDKVIIRNANVIVENFTFIGDVNEAVVGFDEICFGFIDCHVTFRDNRFAGIQCGGSTSVAGLVYTDNCHLVWQRNIIGGCGTMNTLSTIRCDNWLSILFENSQCPDYITIDGDYFEIAGVSNAWLTAFVPGTSNMTRTIDMRNCVFDEGATHAVFMYAGGNLNISNCLIQQGISHAVMAQGGGVGSIKVIDTIIKSTGSGGAERAGIYSDSLPIETDNVTFANDTKYIWADGSTPFVKVINSILNGTTYPTGVRNDSSAVVSFGNASLDSSGKVPAAQLPSYVDDILEVANFAALPVTGETGKIYVTLDNNKQYRWSGSAYVEFPTSPGTTDALTEGSTNLYFTTARVLNTLLTGYVVGSNAVLAATDSIIAAFGKVQAQLNAVLGKLLTGLSLSDATDVVATDSILIAFGKLQRQITDKGEPAWTTNHRSTSVALNLSSHRVINTNIAVVAAATFTIPDGTLVTLVPGTTETIIFHGGVAYPLSFEVPTGSAININSASLRLTAGTYTFTNNSVGQFIWIRYIGSYSGVHEWIAIEYKDATLSGFAKLAGAAFVGATSVIVPNSNTQLTIGRSGSNAGNGLLCANDTYCLVISNTGGTGIVYVAQSGLFQLQYGLTVNGAAVTMSALPTSSPGGSGRLWNDAGTVKIT